MINFVEPAIYVNYWSFSSILYLENLRRVNQTTDIRKGNGLATPLLLTFELQLSEPGTNILPGNYAHGLNYVIADKYHYKKMCNVC